MGLNYTTSTLTAKQREFRELYSEVTLIVDEVHTQVIFIYTQLFSHKYECCLLRFTSQNPTDIIFSKFRSRPCHYTTRWENYPSHGTKSTPASDIRSQNPSQFLATHLPSHDPGLGILGCHSLRIMFPLRNGWRLTLASVQFGLYPNAHTISSACLLALSGKHVPGCSAC